MTLLLSEDEALRDSLLGMTVSDSKSQSRAVGVWFGQPDPEIRAQAFPFVTIDLIDITEATERMMSGRVSPWYYEPSNLGPNQGWDMHYPIPLNLDYQVTTFARQPRHDRQILNQLLGTRLPMRFGSLVVFARNETRTVNGAPTQVPVGTPRRLDVLNIVKRDVTESGKRLFMNAFTIRISSEVPQKFDLNYYTQVLQVRTTLRDYNPGNGLNPRPYTEIESVIPTQPGTND